MKKDIDFALTRVFYMYGVLEGQGLLSENIGDLDEIERICVEIANDWRNFKDIKNNEEEGYPSAYAERVLLEKYGR